MRRHERPASFYFDHSYHLECDPTLLTATFNQGGPHVASIRHGPLFGVQFHPEKSQRNGLRLLRNFTNYVEDLKRGATDA